MTDRAAKRLQDALNILADLEVPSAQQNERSALTLLALADLRPTRAWKSATQPLRRITEIMDWMAEHYGVTYAPNTRETIRRQTVHQFAQLGIVIQNPDDPNRPINSPHWCYQLTDAALAVLQSFGKRTYRNHLKAFLALPAASSLKARNRDLPHEKVKLPDGTVVKLSAGGQNPLIRAIVEQFVPRFIRKPEVLLLGDAGDKLIPHGTNRLAHFGVTLPSRGKSPDVVFHDGDRNWLIIVEAVTTHGPIDQKRKNELQKLFATAHPGLVFVTAFPNRSTFTRFQAEIAWETEVWLADAPDHLIHYNGERFLGPY